MDDARDPIFTLPEERRVPLPVARKQFWAYLMTVLAVVVLFLIVTVNLLPIRWHGPAITTLGLILDAVGVVLIAIPLVSRPIVREGTLFFAQQAPWNQEIRIEHESKLVPVMRLGVIIVIAGFLVQIAGVWLITIGL